MITFEYPTREKVKEVMPIWLMMLILSPFISVGISYASPSVREMVYPEYHECDVMYGDVYIHCVKMSEAIIINFIGLTVIYNLVFFVGLFVKLPQEKKVLDNTIIQY
jgi:hypothetical protein